VAESHAQESAGPKIAEQIKTIQVSIVTDVAAKVAPACGGFQYVCARESKGKHP
jgi:hypothetical protein